LEAILKLKHRENKALRCFNKRLPAGNAIKLIETGAVDTVQVIYNIFEQSRKISCFRL
jgi:hypothetical protein